MSAKVKTLELTENEFILLRRCIKELLSGVNKSWTGTDVKFALSVNEGIDLGAINRKLWYSARKVEELGSEGTA